MSVNYRDACVTCNDLFFKVASTECFLCLTGCMCYPIFTVIASDLYEQKPNVKKSNDKQR